jgi:hypothetical protein
VEATAAAIAAEATAFQLAIENATAAAIAETQATLPPPPPDSPLATPTVDLGLDAPTSLPIETLAVEPPQPGADITVLPPLITVVVGTETPAVVVLVVTSTPDGGEALSQGQRPIVYPTPTATPDFVMVAARTFDIAVTTMGWIWFLVGSLIFFVTTGIVAGLFFRHSETHRFELTEPDYRLEEVPAADHQRPPSRTEHSIDDEWPAELP